ncbi:MAG: tetratricopeptide repeat protein, partial [Candidatus Electryonea clarkiae]|nr:tetratricopeptide repeat protein [Candidatus Electryonea clarkiae]
MNKMKHLKTVIWFFLAFIIIVIPVYAQDEISSSETSVVSYSDAQMTIFGRDKIVQWRSLTDSRDKSPEVEELIQNGLLLLQRADEYSRQMPPEVLAEGVVENLRLMRLKNEFLNILLSLEVEQAKGFPLDRLRQIQNRFESDRDHMLEQISRKRKELITKAERFVATYRTNDLISSVANRDEIISDVMFRLGELYYKEAEEEWTEDDEQYWAMVETLPEDAELPPTPVPDFSKATNMYRRILDEFPNSAFVHESLYNIAVLLVEQESGEATKRQSRDTFETLVSNFPESRYTAEAMYRVGSFHFENAEMPEAIPYFEGVLDYPDSKYYDDALYMLGWCYYRRKPENIDDLVTTNLYYATAVDYFDQTIHYGIDQQEVVVAGGFTTDMSDEAIEYLAICFTLDESAGEWEAAGIDSVVTYMSKDDRRRERYGYDLLQRMGLIYHEQIGSDFIAIDSYQKALDEYPFEPSNPWVHEEIINLYMEAIFDEDAAHDEWRKLFERYRRGSPWDEANHFEQVRLDADTLMQKWYYPYYTIAFREAINTKDPVKATEALRIAENYLLEFPISDKTPRLQYNLGLFLEKEEENLEYQVNAFEAYDDVVTRWGDNDYQERAAEGMIKVALNLIKFEEAGSVVPEPTFVVPEILDTSFLGGPLAARGPETDEPLIEETAPADTEAEETREEVSEEETIDGEPVEILDEEGFDEEDFEDGDMDEEILDEDIDEEYYEDDLEEDSEEEEEFEDEELEGDDEEIDEDEEVEEIDDEEYYEDEEEFDEDEEVEESDEEEYYDDEDLEEGDEEEYYDEEEEELEEIDDEEYYDDEEEFDEEDFEEYEDEEESEDEESEDSDSSNDQGYLNILIPNFEELEDLTPAGWDALEWALASNDDYSIMLSLAMQGQEPQEENPVVEEENETPQDEDNQSEAEKSAEEEAIPETDSEEQLVGEETEEDQIPDDGQVPEEPAVETSGESGEPNEAPVQAEGATEDASMDKAEDATPLLKSEEMLVYATDIFVEKFPENKNASVVVMQAGRIYLDKKHYGDSRNYFERIVADYSESEYFEEAFRGILIGFTASGNFNLAEQTTRRIQDAGITGDLLAEAIKIRGESIFQAAQTAKDQGDPKAAAMEFRRTALDVPDADFADQALFNSGIAFMEVEEWQEAITSFELLVHKYPNSEKWFIKAYQNVAYIYQDNLKQLEVSAATFDTIVNVHPDPKSEEVQVAMSRAADNYEDMEDWNNLLRVAKEYIIRFPEAEDALQWLFDQAGYYLKLEDEAKAMDIYQKFAIEYPDDPRTVKAYYDQALYFYEKSQDKARAKSAFEGTLAAHKRQVEKGGVGNLEYASRAKDVIIGWKMEDFEKIVFAGNTRQINAARDNKEAMRVELVADLTELRGFLQKESFSTYYRIAKLTDAMAIEEEKIKTEEPDDIIKKIEVRRTAVDSTTGLYFSAIADYEGAIKGLDEQMVSFVAARKQLDEITVACEQYIIQTQKKLASPDYSDEEIAQFEAALPDSQKALTNYRKFLEKQDEWIQLGTAYKDSAASRIPEIALHNANLTATIPFLFLDYPDQGTMRWEKLLGRAELLRSLMPPEIRDIVEEYLRVIQAADTSAVSKRGIADIARQKIIWIADSMQQEYIKSLEYSIAEGYEYYLGRWERLITAGDEEAVTFGRLYIEDFPDEISIFQEVIYLFAVGMLEMTSQVLELAISKDSSGHELYLDYSGKTLEKAWSYIERFETFKQQGLESQQSHKEKLESSLLYVEQVGMEGYDVIIPAWEDPMLDFVIACWNIPENLMLQPQPWSNLLARKLVTLEPASYAYLLGIREFVNYAVTDTSWIASIEMIDAGSLASEFDQYEFKPVSVAGFSGPLVGIDELEGPRPDAIAYFEGVFDTTWVDSIVVDPDYIPPDIFETADTSGMIDTLGADSSDVVDTLAFEVGDTLALDTLAQSVVVDTLAADTLAQAGVDSAAIAPDDGVPPGYMKTRVPVLTGRKESSDIVYYVYKFYIKDRVTSAEVKLTADNDYWFYINGELVSSDDTEDSTDWQYVEDNPFVESLRQGENIIVAEVTDPDTSLGGFWMSLMYLTIPELRDDMQVILPGQTVSTESESYDAEGYGGQDEEPETAEPGGYFPDYQDAGEEEEFEKESEEYIEEEAIEEFDTEEEADYDEYEEESYEEEAEEMPEEEAVEEYETEEETGYDEYEEESYEEEAEEMPEEEAAEEYETEEETGYDEYEEESYEEETEEMPEEEAVEEFDPEEEEGYDEYEEESYEEETEEMPEEEAVEEYETEEETGYDEYEEESYEEEAEEMPEEEAVEEYEVEEMPEEETVEEFDAEEEGFDEYEDESYEEEEAEEMLEEEVEEYDEEEYDAEEEYDEEEFDEEEYEDDESYDEEVDEYEDDYEEDEEEDADSEEEYDEESEEYEDDEYYDEEVDEYEEEDIDSEEEYEEETEEYEDDE